LTPERLGPSLKNALVGAAEFYKTMLNNTELKNPHDGVRHFKDTLRPYFVKGVNHVFLWRFLQLFRCYRGNQEFVLWIGRFEVTSRRVLTAWMDLFQHGIPEVTTIEFFNLLAPAVRQQINDMDPEDARQRMVELREEQINVMRTAYRAQFPLTDNLMSLVFLVQADLNENQRERFVTSMSLRQVGMAQYTYLQVKQLFMELFCTTHTGIADPTICHVRRSTFLVLSEGECEGETGYWVTEEETGDEGFVSLYIDDEFWVLNAKRGYSRRKVFHRKFKQGKGKGRGGNQRKRPGFRPRSQRKGKGYLAEGQQFPDDQAFYGKKAGKKGGKKNKDSFKSSKKGKSSKNDASSSTGKANLAATSPSEEHNDVQDSATGQDAWSDDYYWDSNYGCWVYYEQWENQPESWNYFAHNGWDVRSDHRCREIATNFSPFGMVLFIILLMEILLHQFSLLIGYAKLFLHRIRLTIVFVSHQFFESEVEFIQHPAEHEERHFAEPEEVRYDGPTYLAEENVRYNGHVYLNYESNVQHTLLTGYVDMSSNPTYVILDSGCTRAMGSRFAIDRLVKACTNHRYSHLIKFTKEASNNKFSFANGESSHVKEKLVIHLKNPKHPTGWITTTVDILDKGRVPILFSVEQMRNLRMNIEHTPAGEFLTCPVFGLKRYALSVATSNHPLLDVMFLAKCGHKPEHSFAATEKITCPACDGRHRKHTYDEHCNLEKPREPRPKRVTREIRKTIDEKTPVLRKESRTEEPTKRLGVKTTPIQRPIEETTEPTQRPTEEIPVEPDRAIVEEPSKTSSSSGAKPKPVVIEDESTVPVRQERSKNQG